MLGEPTWAEKMMLDQIDAVSKVLGLAPEVWLPTMVGRTAARGLDCQLNAEINKFFFDKLIANIKSGDTKTANMEKWDPSTWPKTAKGVGLYEAPRVRSRITSSSRTARRTTIRLSSRRPGMHARATTKLATALTRRP